MEPSSEMIATALPGEALIKPSAPCDNYCESILQGTCGICGARKEEHDPHAEELQFTDNKGNKIWLSNKLTMADLVARGINVKLMPMEVPLPDGWFEHKPNDPTRPIQ